MCAPFRSQNQKKLLARKAGADIQAMLQRACRRWLSRLMQSVEVPGHMMRHLQALCVQLKQ